MSGPPRAERLRLHAALVVGLSVCLLGFVVELGRGAGGHLVAWVYVVEWPFFAVCGLVLWWKLLHEDPRPDQEPPTSQDPGIEQDSPELAAWQAYVARLEAGEPGAGGPRREGP